ncbi:MAG: transposase [Chloroflexi bacterium]|nr:transposase [Chloroflexota bacterium]
MPDYRRAFFGRTYFFTVVTFDRIPILANETSRSLLHSAWIKVCKRHPFTTDAICLLPEHIHCIWTLPESDTDYSLRWKEIKKSFTMQYLRIIGPGEMRNESRQKRGEAAIWQRRFWEHMIRDEEDLYHHIEYIHYNPVKHGMVERVTDWPWSSFHDYVRKGYYLPEWEPDETNHFDVKYDE